MQVISALAACMLLAAPQAFAQQPRSADPDFDEASLAWERGDYPAALRGFQSLLRGARGDAYLERIALITGELYRVDSLAPDGREVRVASTGDIAAFEVGTGAARKLHLVRLGQRGAPTVIDGFGIAFAPAGDRAAFLRVPATDELRAERATLARLQGAGDREAAQAQSRKIAELEARLARIVVRELASGRETEIADEALLKASPAFAADGRTLYFLGRRADARGTEVYAVDPSTGRPAAVTSDGTLKAGLQVIPGSTKLLYLVEQGDPFQPAAFGRAAPNAAIAIWDAASRQLRTLPGSAPAIAGDGSAIAYLSRVGGDNAVMVARTAGGDPVAVARTASPLAAPTISPDGRRVAYQRTLREDWDIFVVNADGTNEQRLTRDIQDDLLPRWLTPTRILAVMGEGRHRRSYLYDVTTGERTRLFHNNTVRTIAPEYEWAPSRDGSKVLIVAERDGDTVSPERSVFVADLGQRVTKDEVLARVERSLADELALRERGERMFAPIAAAVRQAVAEVSKDRIYRYQHDLFQFDSKHITQPGNRKAIDYIAAQFRSFGYEPTLQWFEPRNNPRTANVLATLKGTTHPELVYVISSHFDSRAEGPGADDNTSGTSVLLEAARVLAKRPLPATIIFAAFTGEEAGLLGSREFVRRAVADSLKLVGALNNDMLGWSNDQRLDNTIRYSNAGIRDLQHAAAINFSRLITYDALYYKSTDAAAYYEAYGDIVGGIGSYPVLANPHYHKVHDVLETINQELVTETAKTTVASLMLLASSPSRLTGLTAKRSGGVVDASWKPSQEKGIASYRVSYGPPDDPMRRTITVREPRARLTGVERGWSVAVKAVNAKGLDAWDWARTVVVED